MLVREKITQHFDCKYSGKNGKRTIPDPTLINPPCHYRICIHSQSEFYQKSRVITLPSNLVQSLVQSLSQHLKVKDTST